ncbi:MAG: type II toxin-antitoxin system prevent-host-death family antitoxin [Desulfovibrio sp.]|jgi:antitoxin (DNA-binding transcriptional repressor) of toxin-antitoxin stability system|nr:type II toxin-antitoxin system prevent-host-death family antitoxin [Desulfovibrio sp.]
MVLMVPTHKAKSILSEMTKRAGEGEAVFIERYGKPVVALVPASYVRRVKRIGILAGKLTLPADLDAQTGGPA